MATLEEKLAGAPMDIEEDVVGKEILKANADEINNRTRLLENEIKVNLKYFIS